MNRSTRLGFVLIVLFGLLAAYALVSRTIQKAEMPTPESPKDGLHLYQGDDFSIRFPEAYSADTTYASQTHGPRLDRGGVRLTIPESMAAGTNLSRDSYISVEEVSGTPCSATLFFTEAVIPNTITDGNTRYSVATLSGAGAGNRYEETVYALQDTNPCIGVRYFIHSTTVENYPEGTVTEFDKQALMNQFDLIRKSLIVHQ